MSSVAAGVGTARPRFCQECALAAAWVRTRTTSFGFLRTLPSRWLSTSAHAQLAAREVEVDRIERAVEPLAVAPGHGQRQRRQIDARTRLPHEVAMSARGMHPSGRRIRTARRVGHVDRQVVRLAADFGVVPFAGDRTAHLLDTVSKVAVAARPERVDHERSRRHAEHGRIVRPARVTIRHGEGPRIVVECRRCRARPRRCRGRAW